MNLEIYTYSKRQTFDQKKKNSEIYTYIHEVRRKLSKQCRKEPSKR